MLAPDVFESVDDSDTGFPQGMGVGSVMVLRRLCFSGMYCLPMQVVWGLCTYAAMRLLITSPSVFLHHLWWHILSPDSVGLFPFSLSDALHAPSLLGTRPSA